MDTAIETAIANHKCPGGVLWLEHDGVAYHKAYGFRALVPKRETDDRGHRVRPGFADQSSRHYTRIMLLIQRGEVKLDAPVKTYIPEFTGGERDQVTVRELLTHTSGLPPDIETRKATGTAERGDS